MHIAMKWVIWLVLVGLVAYFTFFIFAPLGDLHPDHPTLDKKTFYWPSSVRGLLEKLEGFHAKYAEQEMTADLIFPVIYGLMFFLPIFWLTKSVGWPRWLVLLPVITVVGDYIENFTVVALLKRYPGDLGDLPLLASIASATKGVGLMGSMAAIVILAIVWLARRRGAR